MKNRVLTFCDLDDTIMRTNNANIGVVPDKFSWAPNFRGDSFFDEIKKRHPRNWKKLFFKLYNDTNIDRKVLDALTHNKKGSKFKDFIILTAGIADVQLTKIQQSRLVDKVLGTSVVAKSAEKTSKIIEIVRTFNSKDIQKIVIAEDRPHNISPKIIENITQIPVELIKVELAKNGPNLTLIK